MAAYPSLTKLQGIHNHHFEAPTKRIHDGSDVASFLTSLAYKDVMTFILQLNRAVIPRKETVDGSVKTTTWPLNADGVTDSEPIIRLRTLLTKLSDLIDQVPPDTGPRRFGNVSFRRWYKLVEDQIDNLLQDCLPPALLSARTEIGPYLLGSFGSPQRLDYGTGHELSFLAFLACLWKLGFFPQADPGVEERRIVLGVFEGYLELIRKIIKTYTLEPAGSHGVWGLDDNSFLPYIFGSAQLAPAVSDTDDTPTEGSLPDAPEASSVTKQNLVDKEKDKNMYFSAIAFIYEVKKGPFWEHSPMLFDISGIKDGWGKINKGMLKMYNAEVLSKFPVVQHFPFGSLLRWEQDPEARPPAVSTHAASQPLRNPMDTHAPSTMRSAGPPPGSGTAAPWAGSATKAPLGFVNGVTQAPWASRGPPPTVPRGGFTPNQRKPMAPLNELVTGGRRTLAPSEERRKQDRTD
ncbi:Serine/threonine-protein phosphatase 2A activator 1 [Exophiala oligosperma]